MKIADFKIEDWMNKYEASAKYDLSGTCISPFSINELLKICGIDDFNSIFDEKLTYGEIQGSNRLKQAISTLYLSQSPDNITVTHGAIGANQLVFLSLLEKDDEVVSIIPTYQQHYSVPEALGAKVKLYFLKEENNWLPDVEELSKIITQKTKLITLNTPNNPTGCVIPDDLMRKIVDIADSCGVWLLADEAYRGLNHTGNSYSMAVADVYQKGISVGSMSKTYSLPGIRLGWICATPLFIREINKQREYNTISISVLDDYFAALAIENKDKIEKRNFEIINKGKTVLRDWLKKEKNIDCVLPNSGTTVLLKYKKNISSRDFCKKLQEKTGVAILPGETLEMEGYLRVGYCIDTDILKIALEKLSEFLKSL